MPSACLGMNDGVAGECVLTLVQGWFTVPDSK